MELYNESHCADIDNWMWSFLAVKPEALTERHRTMEEQLFFCTQMANELVVGVFPNAEKQKLEILPRDSFVGVLQDGYVPTWAYRKVQQNNPLCLTQNDAGFEKAQNNTSSMNDAVNFSQDDETQTQTQESQTTQSM